MHMLLYLTGILSPQEIRDRIMDANSEFQRKIVEYLESVHIGEFMTGTMDDVKAEVDENCTHKSYADPTQTLPEAPPPFCDCGNCKTCKSLNTWWNRFKHIVDDLVLHSNVHDCGRNRSSTEKANKKDRPTCINKQGHCKARFPRPLFEQTQVDPQTCALNIKKGEAWINTFTPIVTYLLRCNSDVTSLLSGTAIKAIVAYVSDYITKPGLKTYSIFDTIRSVFDRNSEMLGGSLKRKEEARKLMTQIVNNLTAKLEIGGPMASLYLLGNPDHYTSHEFVPVYWKNYVREVLKSWTTDDSQIELHPEKIVLQKAKGVFVGVSTVYDYMYRPAIYEHVNLYEWCQMAKRVKIPIDKQPDLSEGDDELNMLDFEVKQPCKVPSVQKPDTVNLETEFDKLNIKDNEPAIEADVDDIVDDSDSDDSDSESDNESDNDLDKLFLHDHPLYQTHWVQFNERRKNVVPNFVGGSLPRRDRGDREYYCATMMTLFTPWRSGKDLKNDMHSWDATFVDHDFTQCQLQLMDNFNLRYECNDARDDYSAQLRKKNQDGIFPQWMNSDVIGDLDEDHTLEGDNFGEHDNGYDHEDNDTAENKYSTLGQTGRLRQAEMDATEDSVKNAEWLDDSPNGLSHTHTQSIVPDVQQPGSQWKAAVQEKRDQVLAQRNKNISATKSMRKKPGHYTDPNENNVKVVDQAYLTHDYKAKTAAAQQLIDKVVHYFRLNTDQERAFRIIANHASSPQDDQLKMYLAGMGGTGKSQVFKAVMKLFNARNEAHRYVILGPTGTSAALLGGSTYHSFLGISPNSANARNEGVSIAQLKGRLEGVDYIFIDEVSMLSCQDMYRISSRLAKAMNEFDLPFGGINMIFAGDFAQLPPVGGSSLYSSSVGSVDSAMKPHLQEAAIGKAL